MIVRVELEKLGLHAAIVELGEVEVAENLTSKKQKELEIDAPGLCI